MAGARYGESYIYILYDLPYLVPARTQVACYSRRLAVNLLAVVEASATLASFSAASRFHNSALVFVAVAAFLSPSAVLLLSMEHTLFVGGGGLFSTYFT